MRSNRVCGACTLCCRLVPVAEIGKGANERCRHQRLTGCRVYHKEGFPISCALWSCRWLNGDAGELARPDRSHYVVDVMPDAITVQGDDGSEVKWSALQVWVDPLFRDAWRDPSLAAFIERKAMPALLRYNARDADIIWPPSTRPDNEWFMVPSDIKKIVAG